MVDRVAAVDLDGPGGRVIVTLVDDAVRVGDGGKFELEGDKAKPFICFPGESRDWSTPEDMNFK